MSLEMEQTKGSQSESGPKYQYRVATLIAALLSNNKNVENFTIYMNSEGAHSLDDIVAKVHFKEIEKPHIYLVQVKFRSNKVINLSNWLIEKYFHSYKKILRSNNWELRKDIPNENLHFMFFCNKTVRTRLSLLKLNRYECGSAQEVEETIIPFNNSCYKLHPHQQPGDYLEFFDKLYLFLKQPGMEEIVNHIKKICDIHDPMEIIKYFEDYFYTAGLQRKGLSKKIFEVELLKIHLSNYILAPTFKIDMNKDQSNIWNKITLEHDVVVINEEKHIERCAYGCLLQKMEQILDCTFEWDTCIANDGQLNDDVIDKFVQFSEGKESRHWISKPNILKSLLVELWVLDELPLILKTNSELSVLKKFQHLKKKVIIIDDAKTRHAEFDSSGLSIFLHIGDIKSIELRKELLSKILISLQGRKHTRLLNIVTDEEDLLRTLTSSLLLHLMKYRKAYLKEECLRNTKSIYFLIEDENNHQSDKVQDEDENNLQSDKVQDEDENNLQSDKVEVEDVTDNNNICIYCKHSEVEERMNQIKTNSKFKGYSLCHLKKVNDKYTLIKGNKKKLRNFFVDISGDDIYCLGNNTIPVIGRRLTHNETFYIHMRLTKATLEKSCFEKAEKAVFLLSGEIQSLDKVIKKQVLDYTEFCARVNLSEEMDAVNPIVIDQLFNKLIVNPETNAEDTLRKNIFIDISSSFREELWKKLGDELWKKLSHTGYTLVHLKVKNGSLELVKCLNCESLNSFISYTGEKIGEEDFHTETNEGITLINGIAGTGKSLLLSSLSTRYDEKNYVLFFNFIDHRGELANAKSEMFKNPLNFIFEKWEWGNNSERYIDFLFSLYKSHTNSGRSILFIDSFDEVLPFRQVEAVEVIKNIAKDNSMQIIIASRPIADRVLIKNFELQPLGIANLQKTKVRKYIEKHTSIDLSGIHISSIIFKVPLYLNFLLMLNNEKDFDIVDLLEKVLRRKLQLYFHKGNEDYCSEEQRNDVLEVHKWLALATIFGKEMIEEQRQDYKKLVDTCIKTKKIKLGIISKFSDDYAVFIHQTFAEFMIIEWLKTNVAHSFSERVYEYILTKCSTMIVDVFNKTMCRNLKLHEAVFEGNLTFIDTLCDEDKCHLTKVDEFKRTALHVAARNGNPVIVDAILKQMVRYSCNTTGRDLIGWDWIEHAHLQHKNYLKTLCRENLITSLEIYLHATKRQIDIEDFYWTWSNRKYHTGLILLLFNPSLIQDNLQRIVQFAYDITRQDLIYRVIRLYYKNNLKFQQLHEACENSCSVNPNCISFVTRQRLTALHIACIYGNINVVKELLHLGADPSATDLFGKTPVFYSVIQGSGDIVTHLGMNRAQLDIKDVMGYTPLLLAIQHSKIEIFNILLDLGVKVNADKIYRQRRTLLHEAAGRDNQIILSKLLENCVKINRRYKKGQSALCIAVKKNICANVEILLKKGANCNEISLCGRSMLQMSIDPLFDLNIVKLLVDAGADIDYVDDDGTTALHMAVRMKNLDLIKLLLDKGADVNAIDYNSVSVLETAIKYKNKPVVNMLQNKGVALNIEGQYRAYALYGYTTESNTSSLTELGNLMEKEELSLLQCDMRTYYEKIKSASMNDNIKYILNKNVNINRIGEKGLTLLHFAVKSNDLNFAKILLRNGAKINRKAIGGATALHFAVQNENLDMVHMLLKNGGNINLRDDDKIVPLIVAVKLGNLNITKTLLDNGTIVNKEDSCKYRALEVAVRRNNPDITKILLEHHAYHDQTYNITLYQLATRSGNADIQELLEKYKLKYVTMNIYFKWNDLHRAVECNQNDIVVSLLEDTHCGIDINEKDYRDDTALYMAVQNNNEGMAKILLRHRADVNIECSSDTALCRATKWNNRSMVDLLLKHDTVDNASCRKESLLIAIQNNNIDIVKLLLKTKTYLNVYNEIESKFLLHAYTLGNVRMAKLLKEHEAYVSYEEYRKTPLRAAIENNDSDRVNFLILHGDGVNGRYICGSTLLHIAIKNNNKDIVKILLENGGDVNLKDASDRNSLHLATIGNNGDILKMLLKHDAKINHGDDTGFSPLHLASVYQYWDIVKILLENKASVDQREVSGLTALNHAASILNFDILQLLIENGADVNFHSDEHESALHIASRYGRIDMIRMLLENNADINLHAGDIATPLFSAVKYNQIDAIRMLLENGAYINLQTAYGSTVSHIAIRNGNIDVLKLLCDNKPDVNIGDQEGSTPLHLAVQLNNLDMVRIVLDHGALPNIQDIYGNTALHVRVLEYDTLNVSGSGDEIIDILFRHGADPLILNANKKSPFDIICDSGFDSFPINVPDEFLEMVFPSNT